MGERRASTPRRGAKASDKAVESREGDYEFVEVTDTWRKGCSKFPCLPSLQWPGYRTDYKDITVRGKDVVVQVWKGRCQQALGIDDAPGGIGAEVGVYKRPFPKPGKDTPPFLRTILDAAHGGIDLWLPYTDLGVELRFELVNRQTGETFFVSGSTKTYWCTKWMKFASYDAYQKTHRVPKTPDAYQLRYWVDGKLFVWD